MKRYFLVIVCLSIFSGCNFLPGASRNDASADKILQIRLKPNSGANYDYNVLNETETKFEVADKTIESKNRTEYVVNYSVNKDTTGNYLVAIIYKKIHIYSKQNEVESDLDADNASGSLDPVEKMLGALKKARITATVNPSGEVTAVNGYQDIANQFLSEANGMDINAKVAAQKQWQQLIEKNMVKKNMDRLFKMFPDSTLHIGDKWKMEYKEGGDINFVVKDLFTLKSVEDGKAIVESSGHISSDSSATAIMGYQLTSSLSGVQEGEYEVNIKSGMMENCKVSTKLAGTLDALGREIPITINIKIKMEGTEN